MKSVYPIPYVIDKMNNYFYRVTPSRTPQTLREVPETRETPCIFKRYDSLTLPGNM